MINTQGNVIVDWSKEEKIEIENVSKNFIKHKDKYICKSIDLDGYRCKR